MFLKEDFYLHWYTTTNRPKLLQDSCMILRAEFLFECFKLTELEYNTRHLQGGNNLNISNQGQVHHTQTLIKTCLKTLLDQKKAFALWVLSWDMLQSAEAVQVEGDSLQYLRVPDSASSPQDKPPCPWKTSTAIYRR